MRGGEIRENADVTQFVNFRIDDRDYAIDIKKIVEIIYYRPATPLPQAPDFIEGVVDLRGTVIPILDLKKRLEMASVRAAAPNHILIMRINDKTIGAVVDEVKQVLRLKESQIQSPQNTVSGSGSKYLRGVTRLDDRLVFILSVDSLLSGEERSLLKVRPA